MKGTEIGQVVEPPHVIDDDELPAPLKKVLRVATEEDLQTQADSAAIRKDAMIKCRELIEAHGLDMKLVDADVSFGGEKITFSFYSDDRVDFRGLVADLARTLKVRIELRQIGAREEARMVGGLGPCGRHLCCSLFQGDEDPVSIRMAKEQNLPLNPMKISGLCGRLMCCLKYEQEQYVTFRKEAPNKGTSVQVDDISGNVVGYNVLKEAVVVRFEDGSIDDVRLSTCECDESGCLHCVREVEQPKRALSDLAGPAGSLTHSFDFSSIPDGPEESEAGAPNASSPAGAETAEGEEAKGEGRSRSRRSRGRRGGRGRGSGANGDPGAAGATGGAGQPGAAGGESAPKEGEGRSRRPRRRKPAGEGSGEKVPQERTQGGAAGAPGEAGEGAAKRPRRRRRPRRRGASGEGGSGSGEGGNGSSGGGSHGEGGGGGGAEG
jgi:cell fate regulator YaaT (PSP1 superfamily)